MKIAILLLAVSCTASPLVKRQSAVSSLASSAVASVVSSASSRASSAAVIPTSASASASAPRASASQDFASGLLAALRARQASTLASLIEPLAPQLGPVLQQGQWTLFAPGDTELAAVPSSVTSNQTLLTQILSYHLVAGSYPAEALAENVSNIAPTFLTASGLGPNYTNLPLAFTKDVFGTTNIISQNASVVGNSTYQNILIKLIDGVLMPPGNITAELSNPAVGGSGLASALSALLPDVASTLGSAQGVTVFVPSNAAVSQATSALAGIAQTNPSAVSSAVQGHVIPSVVFSTNITDGLTVNSLAGTPLSFISNTTGIFVTGNGVTAQVTSPDHIASNGVLHSIDALLFSAPAGGAAAGGVSASASSAASAASAPASRASSAVSSAAALLSAVSASASA